MAIIGIGNCASSLVQGVERYRDVDLLTEGVPGVMSANIGGYRIRDIEFTAGFDIDAEKVGLDLATAIFHGPNNADRFCVPRYLGAPVHRGMTHDGIGKYVEPLIERALGPTSDIVDILHDTKTDVVLSYLPVGSEEATKWYVERVLDAGCAFVNCIPVFIASSPYWAKRFEDRGLPVLGDDVKSQVGATIVHRVLAQLFRDRGVDLKRTSQLNFGGNTDFLNMLERERLESKKISKTNAITSVLRRALDPDDVHIGPSDHVPWLNDRKHAHIRLEGESFGGLPLNIELKLEVHDSPNSAGVVVDAIRCAKIALDRQYAGAVYAPSACFFKSPPVQADDDRARAALEDWIEDDIEHPGH